MDFALSNPDLNKATGLDLSFDGFDFVVSDGLIEAVLTSLFEDALAPDAFLPAGDDRRGWWMTSLKPDMPNGSRLWLYRREKVMPDLVHRLKEDAESCLFWMIDAQEGVAAAVTAVEARFQRRPGTSGRGRIDGEIIITESRKARVLRLKMDQGNILFNEVVS